MHLIGLRLIASYMIICLFDSIVLSIIFYLNSFDIGVARQLNMGGQNKTLFPSFRSKFYLASLGTELMENIRAESDP